MPWSETLPQVSLAGTLLAVLLLFFAAVGEPLLGRRAYAWLSRSRFDSERSLKLLHSVTMCVHAVWGLLVLLVVVLSPGLSANDLGLRTPHTVGPVVAAAIGGLVALALFWVLVNGMPRREKVLPAKLAARLPEGKGNRSHKGRRAADRPMTLPEPGRRVEELLYPRTRAEQATAAGAAVTGGVFAEILYRGLFITLVASMGLNLFVAALLSILLFSVAHVYQGWWGAAHGALTGTLFTVLYLGTGSLWVPIVVHVALNIRSMVFPPASAAPDEGWYDEYGDYDEYDYDDGYDDEYAEYGDGYGPGDDGRYGDTGEMEAVGAARPDGREGPDGPGGSVGAGFPDDGPGGPRAGADHWAAGPAGRGFPGEGPGGEREGADGRSVGDSGPAGAGNAGVPSWGAAPPEPGRESGAGLGARGAGVPQTSPDGDWSDRGRPPGGADPGADAPSWRIDPATGTYGSSAPTGPSDRSGADGPPEPLGSFGEPTSWESGVARGSGEPSWDPAGPGGRAGPSGPVGPATADERDQTPPARDHWDPRNAPGAPGPHGVAGAHGAHGAPDGPVPPGPGPGPGPGPDGQGPFGPGVPPAGQAPSGTGHFAPGAGDPNRWDYPTRDDPQAYWDMLDEPRGDPPNRNDGNDNEGRGGRGARTDWDARNDWDARGGHP